MSYLLENFVEYDLCKHGGFFQRSYCDVSFSKYSCCSCGKQFTEEEYKKLNEEKIDGK